MAGTCCKMQYFGSLLQNAVTTEGQILCHKSLQGFHFWKERGELPTTAYQQGMLNRNKRDGRSIF